MTISQDVQQLNPGNLVELWQLDATSIGGGVLHFQANEGGTIVWQGVEYSPWQLRGANFARTSGQQPTPTLAVGNIDGSISLLCLQYEDMVGATITRRRTFKKYLDAVNFAGGVNPTADPTQEFTPEIWFIERKSAEDHNVVEFELSSALDFLGIQLPSRQIIANQCPTQWVYRGENCGYTGPPVADELDQPTSNPALDKCGKRLQSCKLRQWPDEILNYGGFPAAGLVRT